MPDVVRLADLVAEVHRAYDPRWAEPWDAVGLVCGNPTDEVRRVLLAVDPVAPVVEEALAWGAGLLVAHHPLYLQGTTSVAADTVKGQVVHRLITGGCGLLVAHTNADVAPDGVSDALAAALGLRDARPLRPTAANPLDKLVVFVPSEDAERLVDALAAAGAGQLGDYERCAWTAEGTGTFVARPGADPAVGRVGERTEVRERRVEMVLPRGKRAAVVRALAAAHPYEEPAFDVVELATLPGRHGLGRVGVLAEPLLLRALVDLVAAVLPRTAAGLRVAGDLDRVVRTVAVCGGSGGDLAASAAAVGADVLLTADLRHHTAGDALSDHGIALIDAPHWATEHPWLERAASLLRAAYPTTVETRVSTIVTDPWTLHRPCAT